MSDYHDMIKYHDMMARTQVDDRLYMLMDEEGSPYRTTENTVYARDPLQPIANVLDALKVVPTTPISRSVTIVAGHFYCGGGLYTFPGVQTLEIPTHPHLATYVFVGLRINKNTNKVTPWINAEYGVVPSYFPEIFPLAIIHRRAGATEFYSDDITDIRPFQNFDVTIPRDKLEIEIACLGPGEATSFSRKPYAGGAPFLQVWQRLGEGTTYNIMHDYRIPIDFPDHWTEYKPFKPLVNGEHLAYNPTTNGVSLTKLNRRLPIDFANLPEIVFVSPLGRDTWPGTKSQPVATLAQALSVATVLPEKTTIWFDTGLYVCAGPLTFNRPLTLVGKDPETVILRVSGRGKLRFTYIGDNPVTFRTMNLQFYGKIQFPDEIEAWIHADRLQVMNCACSIMGEVAACAPFFGAFSSLFLTNCVFHQKFPALATTAKIVQDTPPSEFLGFQNSIYIGPWAQALQMGETNIDANLVDPVLENIEMGKYRPDIESPCIDAGTYAIVGADIDDSAPDIGLYGGQFASLANNSIYPTSALSVFCWPFQTIFGPIIASMTDIVEVYNKPTNTEIYGAVSFNGGKTWVAWDIDRASWVIVQLDQLQTTGNTWAYLKEQLKRTDFSAYSAEIIVAIGLLTMDPEKTPTFLQVEFQGEIDSRSLTPYPLENLDIFVDSTAVFLRNRIQEQVRGLVVTLR